MKMSPATELVWNMAAHEAVLAKAAEIEPDHIFMALLKLADVEDPSISALAGDPQTARALAAERNHVRSLLDQRSIPYTATRRQLRQALGQGSYVHQGDVIHRSQESRRLFARAAQLVPQGSQVLEAQHLLQALLLEPTPAMRAVLQGGAGEAGEPAPQGAATPVLDRVAREPEGEAPLEAVWGPPLQVLTLALQRTEAVPILLVCEAGVPLGALVAAAAQGARGQVRLLSVDLAGLFDGGEEDGLAALLAEAAEAPGVLPFIDLVSPPAPLRARALAALGEAGRQSPGRFVAAVDASTYRDALASAPLARRVRLIWLHDLARAGVPDGQPPIFLANERRIFTAQAMDLLLLARENALEQQAAEIGVEALLAATAQQVEGRVLLARALGVTGAALRARYPQLPGDATRVARPLPLAQEMAGLLARARELALQVPDSLHPGLVGLRHLVCALAMCRPACTLLEARALGEKQAAECLRAWYDDDWHVPGLGGLTQQLRTLRTELLKRVFGQDHAVQAFVEGLFNAQVTAHADASRRSPCAVFVFVGPPGVGKTYLAELGASYLGRPFKRFDMSAYSDHQQHNQLVGFAPSYQAAQPGTLTGFVAENPDAILLFDEIEKAHLNTIQLFLQVLDAGRLEDKFTGKEVSFRDTVIIFTTNRGASLYDRPNATGISASNPLFHRRTILDALGSERGQAGEPAFPQAICSRLATGYPVLFNHLGVNELVGIARNELQRVAGLIEQQYFKTVTCDDILPLALVLREGAAADARTVRSQSGIFLRTELFQFFGLYHPERLEEVLAGIDAVHLGLDPAERANPAVAGLFDPPSKPRVLLVAAPALGELFSQHVPEVEWLLAANAQDALQLLATAEVDIVLLDIWVGRSTSRVDIDGSRTTVQFDYAPAGAHDLAEGQACLRAIHERLPSLPVYLLSLQAAEEAEGSIDEELFLACVRSGGARGLLATSFLADSLPGWEERREAFVRELLQTATRMYRENWARRLAQERKVLSFDTAPAVDRERRCAHIRLRNLRLSRAVAAEDVSELLEEVERPTVRFADVYGAEPAKQALRFVVDWMRNPRRYAALGVRPPKGLLLTGSPGTGKTMLARALAGESDVAFLVASGTDFVTVWQGSGPQNIRNLFARARRYAPAIIFIDELDAIGRKRVGSLGAGRAEESTLNALLTEMDGFGNPSLRPIFLLAATNVPEQLDEALLRRFDRTIEVPPPDRDARAAYLRHELLDRKLSQVSAEVVESLATRSAGMTISDLRRVVNEAAVMAANDASPLTDRIVEEAFEKVRMGEAAKAPDRATLERIARHEAGHALVGWLAGHPPVQVTIVGRGSAGGYVEREAEEDRIIYTRGELEAIIRQAMAGRAAEILYYGDAEGLSTGVAADLRYASAWAERMIREFGMSEEIGQVYIDRHATLDGASAAALRQAAERIVRAQLHEACELLRSHRHLLDRLAAELLARNRLVRADLEGILEHPS